MSVIHPTAQVSPKARIADDVEVGAFALIGDDVQIGRGCQVQHHSTVEGQTTLGENNIVYPYASVGSAPQDISYKNEPTRLRIGNNNVFREFVTINRATLKEKSETVIGNNCFFMAYAHVAHDCFLGDNIVIANGVQLGGHVRLGNYAALGGLAGVHHFVSIGEYAFIAGMARVLKDIPPFMMADGRPARVRAVNTIGLGRRGFSNEQVKAIKESHKLIWRSDYTTGQALNILEEQINNSGDDLPPDTPKIPHIESAKEEIRKLIDFIRHMERGQQGRGLEAHRKIPARRKS
ncbi:MAG: acyl-ACP--UDP-N-acetylglucosamine O-acyltransferase [Planctomycetes bacterium]|nr:acyl-ACP--UDP-N-acetylglucosamine O-acyltransferase [Planctomycetota bacterium]